MSLKIRLSKSKRSSLTYKIVVCETRSKRDGKTIDLLGYYNPQITPPMISIDEKKYQEWLTKGARPTKIIQKLVSK